MTKNPHEYADAKNQPHVQVALRMRAAGISVRAGDTIPYVICQVDHIPNGSKTGFAEKAFHPDDIVHGKKSLGNDETHTEARMTFLSYTCRPNNRYRVVFESTSSSSYCTSVLTYRWN